jgi:hypothetical protein
MSAIDVIIKSDAVHVITDGAGVDAEGCINFVASKVWSIAHCNAVIAVRGPSMAGPFICPCVGTNAATFTELKASAAGVMRECVGELSGLWAGVPLADSMDFVIAGWSETGPDAFLVCSHDRWGPAWPNIQLSGLCNIPGDKEIVEALHLSDIDPEPDSVRMLEISAHRANIYWIPGQKTSVYAGRIETQIICRWPDDVIGKQLGKMEN